MWSTKWSFCCGGATSQGKVSMESREYNNDALLHPAANNGHSSVVGIPLEKVASIEAMGKDNNSPHSILPH